jgi:hypothetical protein
VKAVRFILPFLLAAAVAAGADSLWSPAFKGYLSGGTGLAVGDSFVVQIDASSSLTFSSSSNDSKNLTLEFTGGSAGDLFSFLPQVRTGGTLTTAGKDSISLTTSLPVLVTAIAPDGTAQVQGTRTISVQGKNESITVSGTVSPGLAGKGTISFSQLANARLAYTTLLSSATPVLSAADLQTIVTPAPAAAAPAAAPGAPAGAPTAGAAATAAGAAATTAAPQTTLSIPDARKKQLLLLYLNRLLDVLFTQ